MDLGLRDKIALVTGGSRGIGRAISHQLGTEGCSVSICARTAETLNQTIEEVRSQGVPAHGVVADVTNDGDVERFVGESAEVLGGVDLIVANAGGSTGGGFLDSSPEDWVRTFDINLFHAVRVIRAAAPHMRERGGGSIVIISSISGWKPGARAQYGAAKASEIYLASALARELAPHRIRVNTVSPGSTMYPGGDWDLFRIQQPDRFRDFERRNFPWGRLGTSEEVAQVVVFLLSDRAQWINGANIPVDGAQVQPITM